MGGGEGGVGAEEGKAGALVGSESWARAVGEDSWAQDPEELRALVGSLGGGDGAEAQEGAANLLRYVFEDWREAWRMGPSADPEEEGCGWALAEALPALFRLVGDPEAPARARTLALEALGQLLAADGRFYTHMYTAWRRLGHAEPETLARWLAPPSAADPDSTRLVYKTLRLLRTEWGDCSRVAGVCGALQRLLRRLRREPGLGRLAEARPLPRYDHLRSHNLHDFVHALCVAAPPAKAKGLLGELIQSARTSTFRESHTELLEDFVISHLGSVAPLAAAQTSPSLLEWTDELVGGGIMDLLVQPHVPVYPFLVSVSWERVRRMCEVLSLLLSPDHFSLPVRQERARLLRDAGFGELHNIVFWAPQHLPVHAANQIDALYKAQGDDSRCLVSHLPDFIRFPHY